MEDCEIVRMFWNRDETAIAYAESKYGTKLGVIAMRILNNREDAAECVNDTMLKAWDTIPPQKPVYLFAYMAKICRYFAFGILDRNSAQKRSAEIIELTNELSQCIPDPISEIECDIESREIGHLISTFISGLPKEKRIIFMRRYWYTDSICSISERYGISESKVKTMLFRIRKDLKDFLRKEGVVL